MSPDAAPPFPPPGFVPVQSRLPGIEIYQPAPPENTPQPEVVDFKCPQCGAVTAYSAADGGLTCTHCGYFEAPQAAAVGRRAEQLEFTVETLEKAAAQDAALRQPQGWGESRKELACQSCGAVITLPETSLSATCTFCGSNKVLQRAAAQDGLRPRFLVPFQRDAQACETISRGWLGSSWMTPADLKQATRLGGFNPVYLPYWCFDANTQAAWKAQVGHQETQRYYENGEWKTRTVTKWRWENGQVALKHDDLLEPGAARVSRKLLSEIGAFDLDGLCPYEPKFLAGVQAQSYDIPLENAWESARARMRETTRQACINDASTSMVRDLSMELDFADESWRYLLLPVYVLAYQYRGAAFQALINGQTGAIAGQRPVDWNKIWLAIAALLAPGVLLGLLGLITIPLGGVGLGIGAFGFVLLAIGVGIAIAIYTKANAMDDI
ncbi:MAG: hypothetical protein ACKOC5_16955 [Chloroflexota bacterium]